MCIVLFSFIMFYVSGLASRFVNQHIYSYLCRNLKYSSSYVLFPEIPEDDESTNPLLNTKDLVPFSKLTKRQAYNAALKMSLLQKHNLSEFGNNLDGTEDFFTGRTFNFDELIAPIERHDVPLSFVWSTLQNLYTTGSDVVDKEICDLIHPYAASAFESKYNSHLIYYLFKTLRSAKTCTDEQNRVLDKYVREGVYNGLTLAKKEYHIFLKLNREIDEEEGIFKERLRLYDKRYKNMVVNYDHVRSIPNNILSLMCASAGTERGPWAVTFSPEIYQAYLEHCPCASERKKVWLEYQMRCSNYEQSLSNSKSCDKIRRMRKQLANLLGYSNHFEKLMDTKMAESVEEVRAMITKMLTAALPIQVNEIRQLNEFAKTTAGEEVTQLCDIPYWRRLHKLEVFDSQLILESRQYFSFNNCLQYLRHICLDIFGLEIRDETHSIDTWNSDVQVFSVLEDGELLSHIYIDPYSRSGKLFSMDEAWSFTARTRSKIFGTTPVCYLNFNFVAPLHKNGNCFLSLSNLMTLFEKFGNALTSLACKVQYADVSSPNNIEWDAVDVVGNVLRYMLHDPAHIQRVSRHNATSEKLPLDSCRHLLSDHRYMYAHDLCKQLYVTQLDLQLNTTDDDWLTVQRSVYNQFIPFPLESIDANALGFLECVCRPWCGSVYSRLWSQMVAADVWSAFAEAKDDSETFRNVGKKFRETYLSLGGSLNSRDVFKMFRGRELSSEPFVRINNLGSC